jgi:hypothetical protein
MQELPWQKVPSGQGAPFLAQGAFIPLHSLAVQEDISVDEVRGAINPSEQNPFEQACPMGQWLLARQGSLALPPLILGAVLLEGFTNCRTINTTIATARSVLKSEERLIVSE